MFGNLCEQCFTETIIQLENNTRASKSSWCCCLIDDQVHHNWPRLNAIQIGFDHGWYSKIQEMSCKLSRRRLPGNGPCPALGSNGCIISKCRPITCTTQLCEKMIYILAEAGVICFRKQAPLQIEDIIFLPDILPDLFGRRHGGKFRQVLERKSVATYIESVSRLKVDFAAVPPERRIALANEAIELFMRRGRRKK